MSLTEWRQHPAYGKVPYEALFEGGDPEEPKAPSGLDITDALANFARLQLGFWRDAERQHPGRKRPESQDFYELVLLIHDFRRGQSTDLKPLARAIHWKPGNDPDTLRRFRKLRADTRIQPGDPDAYTQLVVTALTLMQSPKDGVETQRAWTPQYVRLGARWIGRRKEMFVPLALPLASYIRWFRNEVTRIIKNEILPDVDDKSNDKDLRGTKPAREKSIPSLGGGTRISADLRELGDRVRRDGVPLSQLQRAILAEAVNDRYIQDYREIAERLGTNRATTKNAVIRIRKKLKRR